MRLKSMEPGMAPATSATRWLSRGERSPTRTKSPRKVQYTPYLPYTEPQTVHLNGGKLYMRSDIPETRKTCQDAAIVVYQMETVEMGS
jgi:hypothetical protein